MAFDPEEDRRQYRRYDTAAYEPVHELSCGKPFVHPCVSSLPGRSSML